MHAQGSAARTHRAGSIPRQRTPHTPAPGRARWRGQQPSRYPFFFFSFFIPFCLFSFFIENNTQYKSLSDLYEVQICPILDFPSDLTNDYKSIYQKFISEKNIKYYVDIINIDDTVYFNTNFNQPSYTYEIILKLNELEQINSFKISKIPFLEYINNLSNYVELEK